MLVDLGFVPSTTDPCVRRLYTALVEADPFDRLQTYASFFGVGVAYETDALLLVQAPKDESGLVLALKAIPGHRIHRADLEVAFRRCAPQLLAALSETS